MALAIAGTPVTNNASGASLTATYSVPAASLVVVQISLFGKESVPGFRKVTSITDSNGLTWKRRRQIKCHSSYAGTGTSAGVRYLTQEVWWAYATAAQSSAVITATIDNTAKEAANSQIIVFGVSGIVNTTAPWDPGPVPGQFAMGNGGNADPNSATTTANTLQLSFATTIGQSGSTAPLVAGAGWTMIGQNTEGTAPNDMISGVQQRQLGTTGATDTSWGSTARAMWITAPDALSSTATGVNTDISPTPVQGTTAIGVLAFSSNPGTATFSADADTIIMVQLATDDPTNFITVNSITDSTGLTWRRRTKKQLSSSYSNTAGGGKINHEVWWAYADAAVSSATLTVTFSQSATGHNRGHIFTMAQIQNPAAPWDNNASFPAVSSNGTGTASAINPAYTSSQANSRILCFLQALFVSNSNSGAGSGMGLINQTSRSGSTASDGFQVGIESKSQAVAGSGNAPWTINQPEYLVIVDALSGTTVGSSAEFTDGSSSTNLTKISQSLSGNIVSGPRGTITTSLTKISQALAAQEKNAGTIATALTKISQSLSGIVHPTGKITTALTKISQLASNNMTGTIATRLTKASFAATGTIKVTGTIATVLQKANLSVSAKEIFTGTIQMDLNNQVGMNIVARAFVVFTGTITSRLGPANFYLQGEERVIGQITTRLGSADGHIAATVVQAQVIILGPILTALPPFRPLILGAKLGTPGDGKWFSWRQTDS